MLNAGPEGVNGMGIREGERMGKKRVNKERKEGGGKDDTKHQIFIGEGKVLGKQKSCRNRDESFRIKKSEVSQCFPLEGAFLKTDENREKAHPKKE